jgi:ubiquinone/menaquinone biosynthesis C-methylase UbiE
MNDRNRVCPLDVAGSLDNKIRSWLQNPAKILTSYVKKGITIIEIGCSPGFFTLLLAELTSENGKVIAADLQKGMLRKLHQKIKRTNLEGRIKLHKCKQKRMKKGIEDYQKIVMNIKSTRKIYIPFEG